MPKIVSARYEETVRELDLSSSIFYKNAIIYYLITKLQKILSTQLTISYNWNGCVLLNKNNATIKIEIPIQFVCIFVGV